ncbi:hypothetical protein BXZ70DRAFT_1009704 [Cristinia sonorae]|uniref:Uncharacterized protein n=1 Tax=Cristinia sonorae TaxID=1940300 RepID=A0A8K0XN79_9AGAR|nr:hypothetical protein BXZ70DRAFT_1009704 [Cristinia sonorae]
MPPRNTRSVPTSYTPPISSCLSRPHSVSPTSHGTPEDSTGHSPHLPPPSAKPSNVVRTRTWNALPERPIPPQETWATLPPSSSLWRPLSDSPEPSPTTHRPSVAPAFPLVICVYGMQSMTEAIFVPAQPNTSSPPTRTRKRDRSSFIRLFVFQRT